MGTIENVNGKPLDSNANQVRETMASEIQFNVKNDKGDYVLSKGVFGIRMAFLMLKNGKNLQVTEVGKVDDDGNEIGLNYSEGVELSWFHGFIEGVYRMGFDPQPLMQYYLDQVSEVALKAKKGELN